MCEQQQIESLFNKLVQFIQDLATNIQTVCQQKCFNDSFVELFQLRSDYVKQLACLFDILISRYVKNCSINQTFHKVKNLDPIQIWRIIQYCTECLNNLQCQDLCLIIKHIRTMNNYCYNLLLQLKNGEYANIDQICIFNQNLIQELNNLSESLISFSNIFHSNHKKINILQTQTSLRTSDTPIYQNVSTFPDRNRIGRLNDAVSNTLTTADKPSNPTCAAAINHNCYACNIPRNSCVQQHQVPINTSMGGNRFCVQPHPIRFPISTPSNLATLSCMKPINSTMYSKQFEMSHSYLSGPMVYTPEMQTLFASDSIIYARKSGNTWIAENLGALVQTLKEVGQSIEENEHSEILVRKNGELVVRKRKGQRKRILQETNNRRQTSFDRIPYSTRGSDEKYFQSTVNNDDE